MFINLSDEKRETHRENCKWQKSWQKIHKAVCKNRQKWGKVIYLWRPSNWVWKHVSRNTRFSSQLLHYYNQWELSWLLPHKGRLTAACSAEIFTQRYCRCSTDKEIKLISVTLMWQQIIHASIRSHFHWTTQRRRIPWSVAVNGSLYEPSWKKARLITHSSTSVPTVLGPPADTGSQSSHTAGHQACFHCIHGSLPQGCPTLNYRVSVKI